MNVLCRDQALPLVPSNKHVIPCHHAPTSSDERGPNASASRLHEAGGVAGLLEPSPSASATSYPGPATRLGYKTSKQPDLSFDVKKSEPCGLDQDNQGAYRSTNIDAPLNSNSVIRASATRLFFRPHHKRAVMKLVTAPLRLPSSWFAFQWSDAGM